MERWYFTVAFALDEIPDFMTVEDFFEGEQPEVKFPLRDYSVQSADFISATSQVKTVELFINFETASPFPIVVQDFNHDQKYYFNIVIHKQVIKIGGRVLDIYYPDNFQQLYGYKILTSKTDRLNRD